MYQSFKNVSKALNHLGEPISDAYDQNIYDFTGKLQTFLL